MEDRCLLSSTVLEYPLPTPNSLPNYITAGPDGNVWFGESNAPKVGKITPQGAITEFSLPSSLGATGVGDIISGPNDNLWFDVANSNGTGEIVEMTTAGTIVLEFSLANASEANSLAKGSDGNIWFADYSSGVIGRMTPAGQVTYFQAPFGIAESTTGSDGNVWFDATSQNAIGRITPTGDITIFSNLSPSSGRGLTAGPNGNLWWTTSDEIVEMNTAGQVVGTFQDPNDPYELAPGPDGNLYFGERFANNIGMITPQGSITEIPIPTPPGEVGDITKGPDGNMWFTEYGANQIGEVV